MSRLQTLHMKAVFSWSSSRLSRFTLLSLVVALKMSTISGLLAKSGRSLGVIKRESFCFNASRRSVKILAANKDGLQSWSYKIYSMLHLTHIKMKVIYLLGGDSIQADLSPSGCGRFLWVRNLTGSFVLLKCGAASADNSLQ